MELIDRYVYQVGRRLPERTRADVKQELHSLLMDALEERAGRSAGAPATFSEEEQVAVLEEFGPPEQMANKYRPRSRYVIGPKVFDLYLLVVGVVAGAGLLAAIITAIVSMLGPDSKATVFDLLLQTGTIFMNIALSGIGSTTLVFALLERAVPDEEFKLDEDEKWNPRDLPVIEARDEIKRGGLIVEIAFLTLLIIGILAFGNRIGGAYYDGAWHWSPPFFSTAFFSLYLPLFITRWGLSIVLDLVLLRQGRWQLGTRVADVLFHCLDIYILRRLIDGPSIINLEAFQTIFNAAPGAADILNRMMTNGLRIAFLIALLVTILDVASRVYRLIRDYKLWIVVKPKWAEE
ncbi:MAG: hypothetical protein JXR84_07430 [Anaerolineae bacterium]|nr:hypothetical protein [Anaerolineae bacterium]